MISWKRESISRKCAHRERDRRDGCIAAGGRLPEASCQRTALIHWYSSRVRGQNLEGILAELAAELKAGHEGAKARRIADGARRRVSAGGRDTRPPTTIHSATLFGRVSGSRQRQEAGKLQAALPPVASGNTDAPAVNIFDEPRIARAGVSALPAYSLSAASSLRSFASSRSRMRVSVGGVPRSWALNHFCTPVR